MSARPWWLSGAALARHFGGHCRDNAQPSLVNRSVLGLEELEERNLLNGSTFFTTATPVDLSSGFRFLQDSIATASDVKLYAVNLQPRDGLSIDVSTQDSANPLQSVLRVFDATGKQLAIKEDPSQTFQILSLGSPQGGRFYIGVSGAGNDAYDPTTGSSGTGTSTGAFDLGLSVTPNLDDNNETLATAQRLTLTPGLPAYVPGSVNHDLDVDLYQLSLASGNTLYLHLAGPSGGASTDTLRLFDSTGTQVAAADPTAGADGSIRFTAPQGGTYYVGVSGAGNTAYDPTVALSGQNQSEQPYILRAGINLTGGNALFTLATQLDLSLGSSFVQDSIVSASAVKLYAVNLQPRDGLTINVFPQDSANPLHSVLRVFDATGKQLAIKEAPNQTGQILSLGSPAGGRFYIGVSGAGNDAYDPTTGSGEGGGSTGAFDLVLSVTPNLDDNNETLATAQPLTLTPNVPTTVSGSVNHDLDVDLYKVSLAAGDTLSLDLSSPGREIFNSDTLRLFDSTGNEVVGAIDGVTLLGADQIMEFTALQDGTYYIGVAGLGNTAYDPKVALSGQNQSESPYSLRVVVNSAGSQTVLAAATSVDLSSGSDFIEGSLALASSVKLYAVKLQPRDGLTISVFPPYSAGPLVLRVFDAAGNPLAIKDDPSRTVQSLSLGSPQGGTFYIGVSGAGNDAYDPITGSDGTGTSTGDFSLGLQVTPTLDDDNETLATAQRLTLTPGVPDLVFGSVNHDLDVDLYQLSLASGDTLSLHLADPSGGASADTLRLFDSTGTQVAAADPTAGAAQSVEFTASQGGTYYIGVAGSGNTTYDPNRALSGQNQSEGPYSLRAVVNSSGSQTFLTTATPLDLSSGSASVEDSITSASAFKLYAVNLQPGDGLSIDVSTQDSANPLQSVLRVFDATGKQLAIKEDPNQTFQSLSLGSPEGGTFYIGVSGAGNDAYDPTTGSDGTGTSTGDFSLGLQVTPNLDDNNETLATAQPLPLTPGVPATVSGSVNHDLDVDLYQLQVAAGDLLSLHLSGQAGGVNSDTLRLFDSSGTQVAAPDPTAAGDPTVQFTASQGGTYYIGVAGSGNTTYDPKVALSGQNQSESPYSLQVIFAPTIAPHSQTPGEIQRSGDKDTFAVSLSQAGLLTAELAPGAASRLRPQLSLLGPDGQLFVTSDAGGPGDPNADLAQHLNPGTYYLKVSGSGNTTGSYGLATDFVPAFDPFQPAAIDSAITDPLIVAGDFNGDHKLDLAVADQSSGEIEVFLGLGDGSFQKGSLAQFCIDPVSVVVGNFNHDDNQDLVATDSSNHVSVLLGNGDGTFLPAVTFFPTDGPAALAGLNFDVQAVLNAVTATTSSIIRAYLNGHWVEASVNSLTDTVSITNANPIQDPLGAALAGNGASVQQLTVGSRPTEIVAGDFNGDGRLDLATLNGGSHDLSILFGTGDPSHPFAEEQRVPLAGVFPEAVAAGDFNGDGIADLALAGSNGLKVLLGVGDGTFQQADPSLVTGRGPTSIAVGDFNQDGNIDLVTSNAVSGDLSLLLGTGQGGFQPEKRIPLSQSPGAVVAGDLNGDGRLDLKVSSTTPGQNGVELLGLGDGQFRAGPQVPVQAISATEVTADFDGDGKPDLAQISGNVVKVYLSSLARVRAFLMSDTNPPVAQPGKPPPVSVRDLSQQSLDSSRQPVQLIDTVHPRPIDPLPQVPDYVSYPVNGTPVSIVAADFNHDGHIDLATANRDGRDVSVLLNQGKGSFVPAGNVASNSTSDVPLVRDLNGDGVTDYVTLDRSGKILLHLSDPSHPGQFLTTTVVNPDAPARDVAVVSTKEGYLLAAIDRESANTQQGDTISLYSLSGQRVDRLTAGSGATSIAAGDLNGNGQDDLVVANALSNDVSIFLSQPGGGYTALPGISVGSSPAHVTLADMDGDPAHSLDVVVADHLSGDVTVLLNQGAGVFEQERYRAGRDPYGLTSQGFPAEPVIQSLEKTDDLTVGDVTGAGNPDLIVRNPGSRSFALLQNDGSGGFLNPVNLQLPPGAGPSDASSAQVQVADLNHDGLPDLVLLDPASAKLYVYLGQRSGNPADPVTWSAPQMYDAGNAPTGFTIAQTNDDNGDGIIDGRDYPDLVIGNSYGDVLTLLGNGDGTFRPSVLGQSVPFVTADLSGHGQQDVILANQSANQVVSEIRQLGSNTFTAGGFSQTSSDGLQFPGFVTLGDLNGDGLPDLVVANSGSNDVLVYLSTSPGHFSTTPRTFFVGDNPVGVTIADLNGDGVPDLAVANQGSNDVSVLLGQGQGNSWTLTPGPRLIAGAGPIGVAVEDVTGIGSNGQLTGKPDGSPDLVVTNGQDGTMTVLPGLGSNGKGTGFFDDTHSSTLNIPGNPVIKGVDNGFLVTENGRVLDSTTFQPVFTPGPGQSAEAVASIPDSPNLVAALNDGTVALLAPGAAGTFNEVRILGQVSDPSALQVVQLADGQLQVYVTSAGDSMPAILDLTPSEITAPPPPDLSNGEVGGGVPGIPEPNNEEPTNQEPAGPLFAVIDDQTTLPAFNDAQLEGGGQRLQSSDLQPVDNAELALAATLRTGIAEETPEEQGTGGSSFVVGLDSSTLGRAVTALLVGVEEAGPDDDSNTDSGAAGGDGADGAQADQSTPLNEFLKGVDDAIRERKQDVEPGQPQTDSRGPSTEDLYAALDALFGGQQEQPDLCPHNAGQDERLVLALTRETLGLPAPAPITRSLQDVLGEVAFALGTEPAPTTQLPEVPPGSALFGEAGPPALLSTSLPPVEDVREAPPAHPPVATTPDTPHWDVSAALPAVEPAGAGSIPWQPALVLAGWGDACLRDQAAPVRDRKQPPAVAKATHT